MKAKRKVIAIGLTLNELMFLGLTITFIVIGVKISQALDKNTDP